MPNNMNNVPSIMNIAPELAKEYMENVAKSVSKSQLTEQNVDDIMGVMKDNLEGSENLKMIAGLKSNNGVEEHTPEPGYEQTVSMKVDPRTGERAVIGCVSPGSPISMRDAIKKLNEKSDDIVVVVEDDFEINAEDIKKSIKDGTVIDGINISDETALELITVCDNYRKTKKVTYKDLPEEVRKYIDEYMVRNGIITYDAKSNSIRNNIAETLIDQFVTEISMNKSMDDFNSEMESLFDNVGSELSKLYKDYAANREQYIKDLIGEVTDEEKKQTLTNVLDAINDGYTLDRLKEATKNKKVKIKKFDLEKPKKIYDDFLWKYMNNKYKMYDLTVVNQVLVRHMPNFTTEDTILFLVAFCKFCRNYKPEVPEEHAFMYYSIYNIILLDVYKNNDYDEYAPKFIENITEIINNLKA